MSSSESETGSVEPELRGRTPRPVHYTAGTQALRLFLLLLLIGGAGLVLGLANRDLNDLTALRLHGATTWAIVTDMHIHSGRSTTYEVDYNFTADGVAVSSSEEVRSSVYAETNIGDALRVTYLPGQPHTHRVGLVNEKRIDNQRQKWTFGFLGTLLGLGGLLLFTERVRRGHWRLLEEGVPVQGEVTACDIVRSKSTYYYVSYQFPGPAGTQKNRVSVSPALYNACDAGKPLTILYNPSRPNDNRPYLSLTDVTLT